MSTSVTLEHHLLNPPDITHVVPEPRLAPYRRVVGDDPDELGTFYRWCGRLALALFADISALEVALRSAMARELVRVHGREWYRRGDLFDDDCAKALATAWNQSGLRALAADGAAPDVLRLAGFISAQTRTWIEGSSDLVAVIEDCPVQTAALRLR